MGLTLHYKLLAPAAQAEADTVRRLAKLRDRALELPFSAVSNPVRFTESDLIRPWPMRGLAFPSLENVVDVAARSERNDLYRRWIGAPDGAWPRPDVPDDYPVESLGFAIAPGPGCEPAAFGLATMRPIGTTDWSWHWWCKTQYASNHGEDNFVRCHTSLVALLDTARDLGFVVDVHDDSGFWDSRNTAELRARVIEMNRLIARIAGAFVDETRAAGIDSHDVEGAIFEHPDFERLETDE